MSPRPIAVVIPTLNPHPGRLSRTLAALAAQSLPADLWELVVVDNASRPSLTFAALGLERFRHSSLVVEPEPGLTAARRRGLRTTTAGLVILVDDDNVLAPDYLSAAVEIFETNPELGSAGGKSIAEFEVEPPTWATEFLPLLALRDLGNNALFARGLRESDGMHNRYPGCAPIGAGMALRRTAIEPWLASTIDHRLTDRRGNALTSGGDNDMVFHVLHAGWSVGYFPSLSLTHLIPSGRLTASYLGRLNRGIQLSWMQVLRRHDANPWPPLTAVGAAMRQARAAVTHRAWRGPAEHVRWQGACGHFAGRIG